MRWERLPLALAPGHGGKNYDGGFGFVNGEPVLMWDCTNDPVCNSNVSLVGGDPPIVGIARPADPVADPKLASWVKDQHNPIVVDKGCAAHRVQTDPALRSRNAQASRYIYIYIYIKDSALGARSLTSFVCRGGGAA